MKQETYRAVDIDVKNVKRDSLSKYKTRIRKALLGLSRFLDDLAYKI